MMLIIFILYWPPFRDFNNRERVVFVLICFIQLYFLSTCEEPRTSIHLFNWFVKPYYVPSQVLGAHWEAQQHPCLTGLIVLGEAGGREKGRRQ